MSITAMKWVFEHSQTRGSARVLMLALADMANDDGECYPGKANLARKVNVTPQQITRLIQECERLGELKVIPRKGARGSTHNTTNLYQLTAVCKQVSDSARAARPKRERKPAAPLVSDDTLVSPAILPGSVTDDTTLVSPAIPESKDNPKDKSKELPDAAAPDAPAPPKPEKPKAPPKPSDTTPRRELEKRDALYEDVERIIFEIVATDDDPYNFRGLCGNITKWLRGEIRKFKDEALPASPVVEITQRHLEEFVRRYRRANGDTSVPTYPPKFANHWSRLMSETRVAQPSSNGVYHDDLDKALKTIVHPRTGELLTPAQRSITYGLLTARYPDIDAQIAALESTLLEHVP